jgi:uncharacterized protein YndB with AHSA1/START domain
MSIVLATTIEAPPEAVFRALTDADELPRWFPSAAESDPRTGGRFSYRFQFDDASRNHTYAGEYEDVIAVERVRYPWRGELGETTVELRLAPADGATQVTLSHTGWGEGEEWDAARAMHEEGWAFFLANLKTYLERGEDARASALGMKTRTPV